MNAHGARTNRTGTNPHHSTHSHRQYLDTLNARNRIRTPPLVEIEVNCRRALQLVVNRYLPPRHDPIIEALRSPSVLRYAVRFGVPLFVLAAALVMAVSATIFTGAGETLERFYVAEHDIAELQALVQQLQAVGPQSEEQMWAVTQRAINAYHTEFMDMRWKAQVACDLADKNTAHHGLEAEDFGSGLPPPDQLDIHAYDRSLDDYFGRMKRKLNEKLKKPKKPQHDEPYSHDRLTPEDIDRISRAANRSKQF